MRVAFITLAVIFGLGLAYLAILVGPHALEPPLTYGLAQDLTLTVAGRSYKAHEEVNCSVKDQRGGIASMAYNIRHDGLPPMIDLPGNGAVMITGFGPCRWVEEQPPAVALPLKVVGPDEQAGIDRLGGMALFFDDVRSPKRVMVYTLSDLARAKGDISLRAASLTGVQEASPRSYDLDAALPFLERMRAKQPNFTGWTAPQNQAFFVRASIGPAFCKSKGLPGEGWKVSKAGDCSDGGQNADDRLIPLQIDPNYARVDIFPEDLTRPGNGVVIFGAVAAQIRGVASTARGWNVRVCAGEKCFEMPVGGYQDNLRLVDRERKLMIQVSSSKWLPIVFGG